MFAGGPCARELGLGGDPLGYVDGPNAYMYGFGNPADWNDPFGLEGDTGFDR